MKSFLVNPKVQLAASLLAICLIVLIRYPPLVVVRVVILALVFTVVADLFFTFLRKRVLFVPYAAAVTGLIIGLVIDPKISWYGVLLVSAVGMAAKNFLRVGERHIFNPAAAGLVAGGVLWPSSISWWGVAFQTLMPFDFRRLFLFSVLLLPVIVSGYRLRRYGSILSFLASYTILMMILNHLNLAIFRLTLFDPTVLFFSVVMLPEPMTSPVRIRRQIFYGALVGVMSVVVSYSPIGRVLSSYRLFPDSLLPFLLVGNAAFFKFR